ncbi:MAG TPA: GNAT family N-acetyltransferase [Actinomycetota bacterium]|nr:GNAT family N-acetyltransferase [Actinomycetota bacterium]
MSEQTMEVTNNQAESRYEMSMDGAAVGFVDYVLNDGTMILPYIEIDPAYGGRGHGGRLTAAVLDDARARGLKVIPECPFIKAFMRSHPEYSDLHPA